MYISYIETEMCMLYLYTLTWLKKKGIFPERKEAISRPCTYMWDVCLDPNTLLSHPNLLLL